MEKNNSDNSLISLYLKSKYKEIISIILIPVLSYYFYLSAYLFMYGYYFHNEIFSFETLLFPIPFDFKALVFLGVTLMMLLISVSLFVQRVLNSQSSKKLIIQFFNWFLFICILTLGIIGSGFYLFNIPITSEVIGNYLTFLLFITLLAQMRVKKMIVLVDLIRSFFYSIALVFAIIIVNIKVDGIYFIALVMLIFYLLIFLKLSHKKIILTFLNCFTIVLGASIGLNIALKFQTKPIILLAFIIVMTIVISTLSFYYPKIKNKFTNNRKKNKKKNYYIAKVKKFLIRIKDLISKIKSLANNFIENFIEIYKEIIVLFILIFVLYYSYAYGTIIGSSESYSINSSDYVFSNYSISGYFIGGNDGILYFSVDGKLILISDIFKMQQ